MKREPGKIAIFGASGVQGRAQVHAAMAEGYDVRAVSRTPCAFADDRYKKVVVVPASFDDPSSLDDALRGVDTVLAQVPTMGDEDVMRGYLRNFTNALSRSKVPMIVFNVSMWAPRQPCQSAGYNFILETEQILEAANLPIIFLEPTLFMSNLQGNWIKGTVVKEGVFRYPHKPSMEADWICAEDLAQVAIQAMQRLDLIGRKFHVGGPERLKPADVVAILSEVVGRPVRHEYITPRQFAQALWDLLSTVDDYAENAGNMPRGRDEESYVQNIDEFYTFCNDSPLQPFLVKSDEVARDFEVKLTPMREWAGTQSWTVP